MTDLDKLSSLSEVMLGFSIFELSAKTGAASRTKSDADRRDAKPATASSSDFNRGHRRSGSLELGQHLDATVNDESTSYSVGDSGPLILDVDCIKHEPIDVDDDVGAEGDRGDVADSDAVTASPERRYTCKTCDVSFGLPQHLVLTIEF